MQCVYFGTAERKLKANLITCIPSIHIPDMHTCASAIESVSELMSECVKRCGNSCILLGLPNVPYFHQVSSCVCVYLYGNIVNYPMIYDVALLQTQTLRYTESNAYIENETVAIFVYPADHCVFMCVCVKGVQAEHIIIYYYIITEGINLIFCIALAGNSQRRIYME